MSYTITDQCISCQHCQTICPTQAVQIQDGKPWIDPTLCNNCADVYSVPQCTAGCPAPHACVPSPADYWSWWFNTYKNRVSLLDTDSSDAYWEWWFGVYSQRIAMQIHSRRRQGSDSQSHFSINETMNSAMNGLISSQRKTQLIAH